VTKCLALLVLTLALTACAGAHSAVPSLSPAAAHRVARQATQWVDTHGIELAVPARWRLGRGLCGTPKANTVLWNEDGMLACLTGQPRGLSVVEFGSILQRPRGWYRRHTTPVTIDGARALRWDAGTVDGSDEVQLVFPLRGISVTVLSPHRSLLRRILASVRMVRVNEHGCPTRPHPEYRLGPRPSGRFVPHRAVGMIGCSYRGRWLDRSNRIGAGAAARLTRAFDAAPYGFSRAPRGSILPSMCGSSWRGSFVVARFDYAAGPPVSVTAHLEGCTRLGASNGRWAVRMAPRWAFQLTRDSSYAGDFVDPRTAR
jgi:hypothetical protein